MIRSAKVPSSAETKLPLQPCVLPSFSDLLLVLLSVASRQLHRMQRSRSLLQVALPLLRPAGQQYEALRFASATAAKSGPQWVFLGPPGVGKGTYASRVAKALGVPHIAAGDLVRAAIKSGSPLGEQVRLCIAFYRPAMLERRRHPVLLARLLHCGVGRLLLMHFRRVGNAARFLILWSVQV